MYLTNWQPVTSLNDLCQPISHLLCSHGRDFKVLIFGVTDWSQVFHCYLRVFDLAMSCSSFMLETMRPQSCMTSG